MFLNCEADIRYAYCVFRGLPGLQLADVLHVLELPQLGQRVVTQCLVKRCVSVLVLHVELGFRPHQQLVREVKFTFNISTQKSQTVLTPLWANSSNTVLNVVLRMTCVTRF